MSYRDEQDGRDAARYGPRSHFYHRDRMDRGRDQIFTGADFDYRKGFKSEEHRVEDERLAQEQQERDEEDRARNEQEHQAECARRDEWERQEDEDRELEQQEEDRQGES